MITLWLDTAIPPRIVEACATLLGDRCQVRSFRGEAAGAVDDASLWKRVAGDGDAWLVILDPGVPGNPHRREAWRASGAAVAMLRPDWLDVPLEVLAARLVERLAELAGLDPRGRPMLDVPPDPAGRMRVHDGSSP